MQGLYNIQVNTASLANGHSLAAYLTSAAGTLLTHTTVGATQRLDAINPSEFVDGSAYTASSDYLTAIGVVDNAGNWVPFTLNASGELPVAASVNMSGDYPEDSAHVSGDSGLFSLAVRRDTRSAGSDTDGDYSSFNVNAVGELWVKDADTLARLVLINSDTTAILADTASIDTSTQSIDTTTQAILADTANIDTNVAAILADTATIDSQTLSIQNTLTALSKAEDAAHSSGDQGIQALAVRKDSQGSNAADGDYTSLQTWSEGSLKVVDRANGSILQQRVTVAATATALPASALANRRSIMIQNISSTSVWVGSSSVDNTGADTGIEIPKSGFLELEVGPAVAVFAVTASGTADVVVLEAA